MIKPCWLYNECNHRDCEEEFCIRQVKLDFLYNEANVTISQRTSISLYIDVNGSDEKAFDSLTDIKNNIVSYIGQGRNLWIHSKMCGNGKTSWTLKLLQEYFNKIWVTSDLTCRGLFVNVPRYLLELKNSLSNKNDYIQHIRDNILTCDVVIWDDIATKAITTFESENLLSIIDTRLANGKSNFFTSNLNEDEMHECLGDRLASRIVNTSDNILFKGKDKRGLK